MSHVGARPSTEHVINRKNLIALFYVVLCTCVCYFRLFLKSGRTVFGCGTGRTFQNGQAVNGDSSVKYQYSFMNVLHNNQHIINTVRIILLSVILGDVHRSFFHTAFG